MGITNDFRQTIRIAVSRQLSAAEIGRDAGQRANADIASKVAAGRFPATYRRFVDGVEDASDDTLQLPGIISFVGSRLPDAVAYAYQQAVRRSPAKSGHYKSGWFITVDGSPYAGNFADIPPWSEVVLTNREPYHRKIDVGGQRTSVPPGIVEAVRQEVLSKFPGLNVERKLVLIGGAAQYVLRGHQRASGLSYDRKAKKFIQLHPRKATRRPDSQAGELLTYPAVVMSEPT